MVIIKMLCALELDDSEQFRLNDKLRCNPKKEIHILLKRQNIGKIALGTTQGNLNSSSRNSLLPLLMSFLCELLKSLLDNNPKNQRTATEAKYKADVIFSDMFFSNDFCCGDFRQ